MSDPTPDKAPGRPAFRNPVLATLGSLKFALVVVALIALAWISHAGGQGLLTVALGRLPATFSSLVIFLEAIAAACMAWVILGEPVTAIQAGGGLAILAGIYVARPR